VNDERAALESGLSGQYVLEQELGRGGMATVYLARDLKHKRPVALKVLRSEIAASLGGERFRREIETAARLQHPHILTVHDSGESGGYLWFTMPYVRGESLRDRLRRVGPLPVEEALRITGEAAQALQYAHAEGVVHRDIKPENILLTADGSTLVADFGIARAVASGTGQTQHLTDTGFALGTPAYMAPEQALGERHVDQRADQYALAVTCYEMLTGTPPFTGPTPAAMIAKRFSEVHPPRISQERPDAPAHIDHTLQRALALRPEERFGSMSEFQRALAGREAAPEPTVALPAGALSRRAVKRLAVGLAALAVVLSVGFIARRTSGEARDQAESSATPAAATPAAPAVVAVLPMDDPAERGFVGVSYSRELARRLGQVSSLRVLGPDGMETYRAGGDRLKRLGRQLRATSVLEGIIRSVEGTAHMSLQLVAIPSGQVLWKFAEQRSSSELAALTGELTRGVATALGARLGATELSRVERLPTAVPEAYGAYLRSGALDESNRAQNEAGMDLLREAIRADTTFALAWATLARRFMYHGYFVSLSYLDSGMTTVRRALELNPELDEAHFVLGDLQLLGGRHATAQYSYLKAIELNPSHAAAMADLSSAQTTIGRYDESIYWALRGAALYPDAPQLHHHVSLPLAMLADDSASLRWLEDGVRRWPDFSRLEHGISVIELRQGKDSAALARLRRVHRKWPNDEEMLTSLAQVAWLVGTPDADSLVLGRYRAAPDTRPFGFLPYAFRTLLAATRLRHGDAASGRALADSALAFAKKEFERGGEDPGPAVEMAALMALKGRRGEALDWLERAHELGYRDYRWVPRDPFLRTLSKDPRFTRLLTRMESEVAVMRRRVAEAHPSLFRGGTS
jgi:eukaryotic-like serine/threonine-protein kinase